MAGVAAVAIAPLVPHLPLFAQLVLATLVTLAREEKCDWHEKASQVYHCGLSGIQWSVWLGQEGWPIGNSGNKSSCSIKVVT